MDTETYIKYLKRGRSKLPEQVFEKSRFQIPRISSFIEGSRTHITNWRDIVKTLNREPEHIMKYLAREMATSVNEEGIRLGIQGKFSTQAITKLIENYSQIYVICPHCSKPDTKLVKEGRQVRKICEACGGWQSVK